MQGYYFGKPMPASEFIELARGESHLALTA
jgi:EAL domain-containing protein (putative c-di-GMP-specific phosphodiesterase class I)